MQNRNIQVSIITVNYRVEEELINCIESIINSKPTVSYEIIVVDNDEENSLKKTLKEIFHQVKYVKSPRNIGYGAGNNLGYRLTKGEFIFFLNPDTIITKNSIDTLYSFVVNNSKAGMVAPLLLDPKGNTYPYQGSDAYTWISAIVVLSFINKIFPNNLISSKFFHKNWNKKDIEEFDVVPGTAFMVKRDVFEEAGQFDEKLFLYFEEYDLAKRIKQLEYRNYIIPKAKVLHIWEASTKKRADINKIFSQSRYFFFKKNYGVFTTLIVNFFASIGKYELLLGLVLGVSAFLGFYKINELMNFIGDQGWFYFSARDMLTTGEVPLVGIASSRPWLHQGPFWTYILAFFMWIFNFNPVSGAYAAIFLGMLSIIGIYIAGSTILSKRIGLIASLLYATSPLAVYYMRLPYHTSPIPVFVIALIYSLCRIIQNKVAYIPIALFLLGILYNLEIATAALWPVFIGAVSYTLIKNKNSLNKLLNKKILIISGLSILVPLLPMMLYDVGSGFPQTIKFTAWIFYRIVSLFGYNPEHMFSLEKITIMINFLFVNFTKLIFASSVLISSIVLTSLIGWVIYFIFNKRERSRSAWLIILFLFIPLLIVILNQTSSDAYLPMLFPTVILLVAIFIERLIRIRVMLFPVLIFSTIIVVGNIHFMFKNDFTMNKSSTHLLTLNKRIEAAKNILNQVQNKDYNLKGRGPGSEHASFIMNYEYLAWWLGHSPSKEKEKINIYVSESKNGIKIDKLIKK